MLTRFDKMHFVKEYEESRLAFFALPQKDCSLLKRPMPQFSQENWDIRPYASCHCWKTTSAAFGCQTSILMLDLTIRYTFVLTNSLVLLQTMFGGNI